MRDGRKKLKVELSREKKNTPLGHVIKMPLADRLLVSRPFSFTIHWPELCPLILGAAAGF